VILWIDAHLSPALAPWITKRFGIEAYSVKHLGHRDAKDPEIFQAARVAGIVVMTKDSDFLRLLERHGPPPQVLLVTLGNTSNARMREVLERTFPKALELLQKGEAVVEIGEATQAS
jgi:predicted nuclease of predicted toxin-antitoxin system